MRMRTMEVKKMEMRQMVTLPRSILFILVLHSITLWCVRDKAGVCTALVEFQLLQPFTKRRDCPHQ